MPITLYDAFVPTCLQQLGAVSGLLDKAEAHCTANRWQPEKVIQAKLAPDMFDFAYQVKSCYTHSALAIEGAKSGTFSPNMDDAPTTFDGLKALIANAIAAMEAVTVDELEALIGKDAQFAFRDFRIPFTAENFLLSLSLPNFQFHATTAYALLRHLGIEIGKRDYLGAMRMKTDQ
ncbi:DUF1993 domain-containing protein [Croceicoccus sediminis]|uniref:DUF1993 domain-containing protein n=1 Tax=Croceicoccus sediminis TaxID=2571150 RepID=UPI001181EAE2|nr:DUF1993 domain-containing protein [Croceicoccus sediminis]